jgi:hypothetical protein
MDDTSRISDAERKMLRVDHQDHEELIRFLQDSASPTSVGPLRTAILLKPQLHYLDYDDYGSYYKKCLWALQAIGSPEAIEAIEEFATSEIAVLRKQASYRLSRISRA